MTTPQDNKGVSSPPWFVERRGIILIILMVFFFLSVTTFFLCYAHNRNATEQSLKEDRATAHLLSLVLEEHLQAIMKTMESYSNRPLLLQAVSEKNAETAQEHLISLAENNPGIDSVIVTDREGTLWGSFPDRPEVIGKNFAYRDWYRGISNDWKPYISEVVRRVVEEKDLAVQIGVPFFDKRGEVIGILLNTQRTVELGEIIKRVTFDPGAYVDITDRKGNLIYSSRVAYEREITPYPFYSAINKSTDAKNQSGVVKDPSLGGRKWYISYAPATSIGWGVFVGRDSRAILRSGAVYFIQTTAISFLLFLMVTISLVYFRKRVMAAQVMEQLRAEKELRMREEMFGRLFENMINGAAVYEAVHDGENFIIRDFNRAAERMEKVGREDLLGRLVTEVFPGVRDFGLFEVFQRVWKTGIPEDHPIGFYRDGRIEGWRENSVYKLPSGEIVAMYQDVTERKQAEERMEKSLREKESMLQEIHHRVKNNMQIIASMLSLQSDTIGDEETLSILRESESRVKSMALVHEKLYLSPDMSEVNFAEYITSLMLHLSQALNIDPGRIAVVSHVTDSSFEIETAIPCGLLVNELITNALKHAFPEGMKGEIAVDLRRNPDRTLTLTVSDNGIGLPEDIDPFSAKTFGMQLIGIFTEQLDGALEIVRGGGTTFRITFRELQYRKRG